MHVVPTARFCLGAWQVEDRLAPSVTSVVLDYHASVVTGVVLALATLGGVMLRETSRITSLEFIATELILLAAVLSWCGLGVLRALYEPL